MSLRHQQLAAQQHRHLVSGSSPVELGILARLDLADSRVAADRAPDLLLELAGGDVIAEEGVVCFLVSHPSYIHLHHLLKPTIYLLRHDEITYSTRTDQATAHCPRNVRRHSQSTTSCARPSG